MIIDPVMDFDLASGRTTDDHNEAVAEYCKGLEVEWIVETHVHADHLTGAQYLQKVFPEAKTGIGENVVKVQGLFKVRVFTLLH